MSGSEVAKYEDFFKEADVNNDGELSLSELTTMLRKHGYTGTDQEIEGFFVTADLTGNNAITFDEYLIAMGKVPPNYHKSALLRGMFADIDSDGSGEIDKHELISVLNEMEMGIPDEELEEIMNKVDKDGNGKLNYEEFVRILLLPKEEL